MKTEERSNSEEHYSSDSSTDFFDAMDKDVNSMVSEESQSEPMNETTQKKVNNTARTGSQNINWKKRYQDSSREAQRMNGEMQSLKPYAAIIEAMKKDGGLVDHVRGYLEGGGSNQSIQSKLGLAEDFEFDGNELGDPKSDSSKVLNAHVDGLVQSRMGQINQLQNQKAQEHAEWMYNTGRLEHSKKYIENILYGSDKIFTLKLSTLFNVAIF